MTQIPRDGLLQVDEVGRGVGEEEGGGTESEMVGHGSGGNWDGRGKVRIGSEGQGVTPTKTSELDFGGM